MAPNLYVISGFCHEVDENCTLQAYYTVSSGNFLPTFQGNVSIPPFLDTTLEDAINTLSQTSVTNYLYSPHNSPKQRSSQHLA